MRVCGIGAGSSGIAAVANGHHWDPRWPEPAFPGHERFAGVQLHSHAYTGEDPGPFRDRAVVVLVLATRRERARGAKRAVPA